MVRVHIKDGRVVGRPNLGLGMNPALVGFLGALPRLTDAITDPLMGYISDNTTDRLIVTGIINHYRNFVFQMMLSTWTFSYLERSNSMPHIFQMGTCIYITENFFYLLIGSHTIYSCSYY